MDRKERVSEVVAKLGGAGQIMRAVYFAQRLRPVGSSFPTTGPRVARCQGGGVGRRQEATRSRIQVEVVRTVYSSVDAGHGIAEPFTGRWNRPADAGRTNVATRVFVSVCWLFPPPGRRAAVCSTIGSRGHRRADRRPHTAARFRGRANQRGLFRLSHRRRLHRRRLTAT